MRPPVPIIALDVPDARTALGLVDELRGLCGFFKIGSELYTAEGPAVVMAVRERGASVFLDLKFHDIPNTVAAAVQSAGALGVELLTVHASGGPAMLSAAVGSAASAPRCRIMAVTLLTSLDPSAAGAVWGRRVDDMQLEVLRLAQLAADAGVHGVVCSGLEAAAVRERFGGALATLVPGVRLPGDAHGDQSRVVTPRGAAEAGASYIVLGRAVTAAKSRREAMERVLTDLS